LSLNDALFLSVKVIGRPLVGCNNTGWNPTLRKITMLVNADEKRKKEEDCI
jgi:hypothetical protein